MPLRPRAVKILPFLLVAALAVPCLVGAESVKSLKPTGYVNDFAQIFNIGTTKQLKRSWELLHPQSKGVHLNEVHPWSETKVCGHFDSSLTANHHF